MQLPHTSPIDARRRPTDTNAWIQLKCKCILVHSSVVQSHHELHHYDLNDDDIDDMDDIVVVVVPLNAGQCCRWLPI